MPAPARRPITIRHALPSDRPAIYRLRHDVYAVELAQHPANPDRILTDALDAHNHYLIAERPTDTTPELLGFISITLPSAPSLSIEKYLPRAALPFPITSGTYEVRLLTVARPYRRGPASLLLVKAALDHIRSLQGDRIVIMGRRPLVPFYQSLGLEPTGLTMTSGACTYEVMHATLTDLEARTRRHAPVRQRLESRTSAPDAPHNHTCDHGGAFFSALGPRFDHLSRRHSIINADVLDAWFPPAPRALEALQEDLAWTLRTSPPTRCEGLTAQIAEARNIPEAAIVPGAGSSDLIFRALTHWLTPAAAACILDPMYGEYAHVLEHVIGCTPRRLVLDPHADFGLDPADLRRELQAGHDWVILVNPNNPSGHAIPHRDLAALLADRHPRTRVWIDETYSEYGGEPSLEALAASTPGVVICKSLSKVYALSGARVAYLVAHPEAAGDLRRRTPPWAVSLPAQIAAVQALQSHTYYEQRWAETHAHRATLAAALRALGLRVVEGVINSVLCELPAGRSARAIVERCRGSGVYIRDCSSISRVFADRWVRVAVRPPGERAAVIHAIANALEESAHEKSPAWAGLSGDQVVRITSCSTQGTPG